MTYPRERFRDQAVAFSTLYPEAKWHPKDLPSMTQEEFAKRVMGDFGGNAAFFDDLLAFITELLPIIIPLFGNCQSARLRRSAARERGLFYRMGMLRLNYTISREIGTEAYAAYGTHLSQAMVSAIASSTDAEVEQLLATG